MIFAAAQLNPTVGALSMNTAAIAHAAKGARFGEARLLITPELSICGYPPLDLLSHSGFVEDCFHHVKQLAEKDARDGLAILVGFPEADGGKLYNSVAVLDEGKIVDIVRKRLLPTYDVFDERRYFTPGSESRPVELDGRKFGIHICEDAWNDHTFWDKPLYEIDPVQELVDAGSEILINLSASPWAKGRDTFRVDMFQHSCERHGLPGIMLNQVGGNDDLVFDGSSFVIGSDGAVQEELAQFEKDARVFELLDGYQRSSSDTIHEVQISAIHKLRRALELGVADYVYKCGFSKVVLGLSGGIDSALVTCIAAHALGAENVHAVGMPSSFSSKGSIDDSRELCKNLGVKFDLISISDIYDQYITVLHPFFKGKTHDITEENLQPRIRGMLLMALSNKLGSLVLATGNKSELAVGYSTLYGDMCGGLEVIGDVLKTEAYQLARDYNARKEVIPTAIIDKPPSAELRPGQLDTDSLPPYEELDPILNGYIEERMSKSALIQAGHDAELVGRVLQLVDRAEYKRRQAPPVLRVSSKAFGRGRQMPLAQRYLHS